MNILRQKIKDPRIEWITINDVEVSKDNTLARIFWTVLLDENRPQVEKALEAAKGFIRSELAHGFKTYTIPQLKFVYDESMVRGSRMLSILNQVKEEFPEETPDDENKSEV